MSAVDACAAVPCAGRVLPVLKELGPAPQCGAEDPGRPPPRDGPRYLRYRDGAAMAPGMNHQLGNLACLLREADALGRLAVLPPLRLSAAHNFGVARAWCWETYFDLAASRLVAADGEEHSLPLARRPVGGTERPFVLAPGERLPDGARDRCVVERYVYSDVQARDVPELAGAAPQFKLVPSARVRALARPVIAVLREGGCFAAVHVRRGDRRYGPLRWLTRPARIAGRLRALGVPAGASVFVLSDERDARYWRAFARTVGYRFAVLRAVDVAALAALVPPASACPDNYLLYEAEKEVMRSATWRLETFPGLAPDPADAVLVPTPVWLAVRTVRRSLSATLRLVRRTVGERAWAVARAVAGQRKSVQEPVRACCGGVGTGTQVTVSCKAR